MCSTPHHNGRALLNLDNRAMTESAGHASITHPRQRKSQVASSPPMSLGHVDVRITFSRIPRSALSSIRAREAHRLPPSGCCSDDVRARGTVAVRFASRLDTCFVCRVELSDLPGDDHNDAGVRCEHGACETIRRHEFGHACIVAQFGQVLRHSKGPWKVHGFDDRIAGLGL